MPGRYDYLSFVAKAVSDASYLDEIRGTKHYERLSSEEKRALNTRAIDLCKQVPPRGFEYAGSTDVEPSFSPNLGATFPKAITPMVQDAGQALSRDKSGCCRVGYSPCLCSLSLSLCLCVRVRLRLHECIWVNTSTC